MGLSARLEAKAWLLSGFAGYCCLVSPPARAEENLLGDGPRVQEYDEIVSPDLTHASSYAERARVALKNGNVSRALSLCKKALKEDDNDADIHLYYAEALEAKLVRQPEKDPDVFKECVHEWLMVYRNERGEERGMTFKGLNPVGTWWNDDNRGAVAKIHLKKLVGYVPKAWETDNKFMAKATRPSATQVSGKVSTSTAVKLREKP